MNKRRLLKLADLLEADAKNKKGIKFDLGVVGTCYNEDSPFEMNCGTSACAMGLAALSGEFKGTAKLSYRADGSYLIPTIGGRDVSYDRAAMKIFNITMRQADFLFTPSEYDGIPKGAAGERLVAKRIRDFVAGKASPT